MAERDAEAGEILFGEVRQHVPLDGLLSKDVRVALESDFGEPGLDVVHLGS